jgi:hypothetical protein
MPTIGYHAGGPGWAMPFADSVSPTTSASPTDVAGSFDRSKEHPVPAMSDVKTRLQVRWQRSQMILRAPRVRIDLFGDADVLETYQDFTARHPRFRFTSAKRWGVALLRLPDDAATYLGGRDRQAIRTNRNRAEKAGYHYEVVSSEDYLDDIVEVNRSAHARQGRPMGEAAYDRDEVARAFDGHGRIHGVIDQGGRLRAYAVTPNLGDCVVISVILGHADALEHGVMYMLVSGLVRTTMDGRDPDGTPHWVMYDTFWGAGAGLEYFKRRLGFEPYTVSWAWKEPGGLASGTRRGDPLDRPGHGPIADT